MDGSSRVKTKQAKDFLVQQAAEQAARENVPLSDIEIRMMYFIESDPASCENPVETNDEFETQYDTAEYEAKISRVMVTLLKRANGLVPMALAFRILRFQSVVSVAKKSYSIIAEVLLISASVALVLLLFVHPQVRLRKRALP